MRNWAVLVIWAGMALGGSVLATVGQDRWLIAGGGAVIGVSLMVGVTFLLWSLALSRLIRLLHELFRDLRDLRDLMEGHTGWERSGRNAPPDRFQSYQSSSNPWPWRW